MAFLENEFAAEFDEGHFIVLPEHATVFGKSAACVRFEHAHFVFGKCVLVFDFHAEIAYSEVIGGVEK